VSRSRLVAFALVVTLLLAVVAIVARGRPLGTTAGHGGGLPLSFWDYTYTTVVIITVPILFLLGFAALFMRGPRRGKAPFQSRMILTIAGFALFAMLATLLRRHGFHLQLHHPQDAQQGVANPKAPKGQQLTSRRAPTFKWGEAVILLAIVVLVSGIVAATRSRRAPRVFGESAPETLATALDDSLDDLRADPDLRRAIIAAYARMEKALAAAGIPRHAAEAPLEYVERALLGLDTSAGAVRRLTDLFEWARFSHHEPEPAMRDDAVDALSAVRDELRPSELAPA
jgi:uncharacterized protein DUF4129